MSEHGIDDQFVRLVGVTMTIASRIAEHASPDLSGPGIATMARAFPQFGESFWQDFAECHDVTSRRELLLISVAFLQGYELARQEHSS